MKATRLLRTELSADAIDGVVTVTDVNDDNGLAVVGRGSLLIRDDVDRLARLSWDELHILRLDPGDVPELEAGTRLARAAAGPGTVSGTPSGGHWPISAMQRGLVSVRRASLGDVNGLNGLAVYTLPDGQVVETGEVVARAKILPFAVPDAVLDRGEALSRAAGGLVSVSPFQRLRVQAVVQESIGSSALERFHVALAGKVEWTGGTLDGVSSVPASVEAIAEALASACGESNLVVIAGTKAMDPLDPAFGAIDRAGGRIERIGVPAHPGSLLWLARVAGVPVVGMPSCGLFSRATVFDLLLPRFMAGLPVDAAWLAGLGDGGLLTRDMSWRFPPYRARQERGAFD